MRSYFPPERPKPRCHTTDMSTRDNFKSSTKIRLRERVNGICCRCRGATLGAHTDPTKGAVNVGVAAHICAAAPGGPRYDKKMTPAQRSHFDNGIWLCQSCSTFIDKDTDSFTPSFLRAWKAEAEQFSRQNIGRRVPTEQDSRDQVLMMLSGVAASNQLNVIENAHAASQTMLERMDSRFRVETSFAGNVTRYTFHAIEPVRISFNVGPSVARAWQRGLENLVKHARPAHLPADDIRLQGSPVFEQIRPEEYVGAKLTISPDGLPAVVKVSLRDSESGVVFSLDDVIGVLRRGTETARFTGKSCGDIVSVELAIPRKEPRKGKFTISTDFERWVGRDVQALPYFEKLFQFYERAKEGWVVDLQLEVEGNRLFGSTAEMPLDDDTFMYTHVTLAYCNRVRVLAKHIGRKLEFRLEPSFNAGQHRDLAELADIARGKHVFDASEVDDIRHTLTAEANSENIRMLHDNPGPHTIVVAGTPDPVVVYGQEVVLPQIRRVFEDVTAEIDASVNIDSLAAGDEVPVTWTKGPAFKLTLEFETEAQAAVRISSSM